jgi:hypothetical protein
VAKFHSKGFSHSYEIEFDPEYPADGIWREPIFEIDVIDAPTGSTASVVARVLTSAGSWLLAAQGGDELVCCGTPDPDLLCIVPGDGEFGGMLVDVRDPQRRTQLDLYMPKPVRVPDQDWLLLVSLTEMAGVNSTGLAWKSEVDLAIDDLTVVSIEGDLITCTGLDATGEGTETFAVRLSSGRAIR